MVQLVSEAMVSAFTLDPGLAAVMAQRVADEARKQGGGRWVYVPAPDLRTRNQAIRAQWTGSNVTQLATAWSLSPKQIHRIVTEDISA